ncbi:3-dehydrosphinganine reductase [Ascosphaera aggregata]|nr:3-dehydrosphinganine reductase [Ascosphaera aggregata]
MVGYSVGWFVATLGVAFAVSNLFRLLKKNQFEVDGKTVVITGGSDGLGKSIAVQLSQKGANVIIVARNKQKLAQALEEIQSKAKETTQRFTSISADLTNAADAERAIQEATTFNNGTAPDILWCCAGNCAPGFFAASSIDTLRSQMDTVYWTAAYTAHATLQQWVNPVDMSSNARTTSSSPSSRHLIFTSSTLAFTPVAGYAPYSPAKAAMRSLADTLNQEVEVYNGSRQGKGLAPERDIRVHIVFPMGILSPGYQNEEQTKPALTKKLEESDKPQTPEEVAQLTIKALEKGEYLITTTFIGMMMKASAIASSARNYPLTDTILSVISNVIFLGVIHDLHRTSSNWGRKKGMPEATK